MAFEDRQYNRADYSGGVPPVSFRFPPLTRLTVAIMVTCLVVFILQRSGISEWVDYWGCLTFRGGLGWIQPWRLITYQYLHADAGHIFFNMLALYFFLPSLEMMWGWRKAFAFYTAGGVAAGVAFALLSQFSRLNGIPLIGASGAVFAAMGAVALLNPQRQLILLIFPVPIRVAVALFGAFFLLSAIADRDLSSAAHLGGLAFGFFAPWLGGPKLRQWQDQYQQGRQRRAVRSEQDVQENVDRILQKVHEQGMNSLSRGERNYLKRATEQQRNQEAKKSAARKKSFGL